MATHARHCKRSFSYEHSVRLVKEEGEKVFSVSLGIVETRTKRKRLCERNGSTVHNENGSFILQKQCYSQTLQFNDTRYARDCRLLIRGIFLIIKINSSTSGGKKLGEVSLTLTRCYNVPL